LDFLLAFRLPAIASRSGEAGGDESQQIKIAFGDKTYYFLKINVRSNSEII
jgi:hypothetical protein